VAAVPSVDDLRNRAFALVRVAVGGERRPFAAGSAVQLTFTDVGAGVQGSCNGMGSPVADVRDGRLVLAIGGREEMRCDEARMRDDAWLVAFLAAGPLVELDGDRLTLRTRDALVVGHGRRPEAG
jgi:hypothetical protein